MDSATALSNAAENWADKVLEPAHIRDEGYRTNVPHDFFSEEVPIISLAGLTTPDGGGVGSRRSEVVELITRASEEWGLFQVVDHGVDGSLVSEMCRLARVFFALPMDDKLAHHVHRPDGSTDGGFFISSPFKCDAVRDWREFYIFSTYPVAARDYFLWPDKPHAWSTAVEEYSAALQRVARLLMELVSQAMGLDRDSVARACGGDGKMKQQVIVNFYPTCPQPELTFGVRRHTDPGTITLLLQDHVSGLQVSKDGGQTWVTVRPVEGSLVVNLGDHAHEDVALCHACSILATAGSRAPSTGWS